MYSINKSSSWNPVEEWYLFLFHPSKVVLHHPLFNGWPACTCLTWLRFIRKNDDRFIACRARRVWGSLRGIDSYHGGHGGFLGALNTSLWTKKVCEPQTKTLSGLTYWGDTKKYGRDSVIVLPNNGNLTIFCEATMYFWDAVGVAHWLWGWAVVKSLVLGESTDGMICPLGFLWVF